jgi:hypothetical protein
VAERAQDLQVSEPGQDPDAHPRAALPPLQLPHGPRRSGPHEPALHNLSAPAVLPGRGRPEPRLRVRRAALPRRHHQHHHPPPALPRQQPDRPQAAPGLLRPHLQEDLQVQLLWQGERGVWAHNEPDHERLWPPGARHLVSGLLDHRPAGGAVRHIRAGADCGRALPDWPGGYVCFRALTVDCQQDDRPYEVL